jgi:uncharacterized protein (TIRG00374 family)
VRRVRRALRLIPGLAVSLGFTAWFLYRVEWSALSGAIRGVNPLWVVASTAVLFTEFVIRAVRWKVLLGDIAPAVRLARLFVATVIGMSLNVVLPFRAGDFARPWLGSRETGTPMLPLFTIAVIERVFDILGLVSVLCVMVLVLPANAQAHGELVTNLQVYGTVFGLSGALGMGTFLAMALNEGRARSLFERLATLLPGPMRGRAVFLYNGFTGGLSSIRSGRRLVQAATLSLLHWMNGSISIWCLFHAFDIDLPFAAACFTTVAIALTVALPQAPGFFGVFHVAIEKTLVLWGTDTAPSQAFAIVFWAVSFVPVTTIGAVLWWREGLSMRVLRERMATDGPTETTAK